MNQTKKSETEATAASHTTVIAALVVRMDLERWPALKAMAEELGATVVYQRIAPPQTHLWIMDRTPEELPRRGLARGWDQ